MTQVDIGGIATEKAVRSAAEKIGTADGDAVQLDFSADSRISPQWGMVFSNLLAQKARSRPLRVSLPGSEAPRRQLARAGVFFALARHPGLDRRLLTDGDQQLLDRWTFDWTPGSDDSSSMFDFEDLPGDARDPGHLDSKLVAFLNPDRVAAFDVEHRGVVHPWLRTMVGKDAEGIPKLSGAALSEVSLAISELVDNVQQHADLAHDGLSSVSVFVTKGRPDLLYLTVSDTGVGMVAKLHEKYPDLTESPERLVALPFDGELPGRARDRGRGLHRLSDIVDRHGGSLFFATGSVIESTLLVHRAKGRTTVSGSTLGVVGTVAVVSIPLARLLGSRRQRDERH